MWVFRSDCGRVCDDKDGRLVLCSSFSVYRLPFSVHRVLCTLGCVTLSQAIGYEP